MYNKTKSTAYGIFHSVKTEVAPPNRKAICKGAKHP